MKVCGVAQNRAAEGTHTGCAGPDDALSAVERPDVRRVLIGWDGQLARISGLHTASSVYRSPPRPARPHRVRPRHGALGPTSAVAWQTSIGVSCRPGRRRGVPAADHDTAMSDTEAAEVMLEWMARPIRQSRPRH